LGTCDIPEVNDMFLSTLKLSNKNIYLEDINKGISKKSNIIQLTNTVAEQPPVLAIKGIIASREIINAPSNNVLLPGTYDIKVSLSDIFGDKSVAKIYHMLYYFLEKQTVNATKYYDGIINAILADTTILIRE
jgi:hypothetical protein